MNRHHIFLIIIGAVFALFTIVFVAFPRSTFSELEKRDLAQFPDFSGHDLVSGDFARDVSHWFSDSEPFRDDFMTLHMRLRDCLAWHVNGDDAVTFHAEAPTAQAVEVDETMAGGDEEQEFAPIGANAPAKVASAGIIVAGQEPTVRAMMVYKGEAFGGKPWAEAANFYQRELGAGVQVYCMVIPTPIEFYCPDKVKSRTYPQLPTIKNIHSLLDPQVKAVDIYTPLCRHAAEPIYHRTDHHWTPLGAYYAAQKLAQVAGVPFRTIDQFNRHSRPGFVGSMFGYSKDISVKNSPEEFVWYTPKDSSYTTTYRAFSLDSEFRVTAVSRPYAGKFFMPESYRGGGSYSMFMGGDAKVTKVVANGPKGRRLMIIKDSFGNALPPFLFGSFEEVHVIDHRYFVDNLESYIRQNRITDLVMVNNIFNAYSAAVAQAYRTILTQPDGSFAVKKVVHKAAPAPKKTDTADPTPVESGQASAEGAQDSSGEAPSEE